MQFDLFQVLDRLGIQLGSGAPIICVITGGDLGVRASPRPRPWVVREDGAAMVERFLFDLAGGSFGGAVLPARSLDLFQCYRAWCHRSELEPLNQPRFTRALTQGGRVQIRTRRYSMDGRIAQHAIAFEGGRPVPEQGGVSGASALGAHVAAFRSTTKTYRAGGA